MKRAWRWYWWAKTEYLLVSWAPKMTKVPLNRINCYGKLNWLDHPKIVSDKFDKFGGIIQVFWVLLQILPNFETVIPIILWKHFTKISVGLYIRVYNAHFINVSLLWNMVFTSKVVKKDFQNCLQAQRLGYRNTVKTLFLVWLSFIWNIVSYSQVHIQV